MMLAKRRSRRIAAPPPLPAPPAPVVQLFGPTEVQLDNGKYERVDAIHADTAQRVTVWVNRGGTPLARWIASRMLSDAHQATISDCLGLWAAIEQTTPVTAHYGERASSPSNGSVEANAFRVLHAKKTLAKYEARIPKQLWRVFENVCRFDMPAGVAGSSLGYGTRAAEIRAHTIVCLVADLIAGRGSGSV